MQDVGLGNLTIDPKTNTPRLSSMASGIDTATLTQALYESKLLPADRLENRIQVNEAKVQAYGELRSRLQDMQNALEGLRNPAGLNGIEENLFETKAAYISSNTTTPPNSLVGVQAGNRAEVGSFELTIDSLASAHKVMSDAFASADEQLGISGPETLTVGVGGGTTADIAVTADMDVYELRDAINAESVTTDVQASVLKVSDTDYRLVLTGQESGAANTIQLSGAPETLARLNTAAPANELAAASDAELRVDGVSIVRSDNTITDLMDGITLDLYQADPATTVTVDVEPDFSEAAGAVQTFVQAYNGFRDFIQAQRSVSDEGSVDKLAAPLFADSLMRNIANDLGLEIGSAVQGLGTDVPRTLRDLGITMEQDGYLSLDQAKLENELLANPEAVRDVFEFRSTTSDPGLAIFDHSNAMPSSTFQVEKLAGGTWELRDGTHTIALEQTGNTLRAPDGSAYAGLVMFWNDPADPAGPIDVTATQGIADRLYNGIERATASLDGTIQDAINNTNAESQRWREDIAEIERRAEDYRLMLIEKFARMEDALALSESMLTQVRAQTDAMRPNN